jgi:hypothetical protein
LGFNPFRIFLLNILSVLNPACHLLVPVVSEPCTGVQAMAEYNTRKGWAKEMCDDNKFKSSRIF